jgi:hypothetical protein
MATTFHSLAAVTVVLALAACAEAPTAALNAEDVQPAASMSTLGEIDFMHVEEQTDAWLVYLATTHDSSLTYREWMILDGAADHSPWGTGAYKYTVIRYKSEGPGCVEVGLSTGFSNGTWKWRSAGVQVDGSGECGDGISVE